MVEWEDRVVVLSARRFGDVDAIVDVFGPRAGRRRALVRGGRSRRRTGGLQPGNTLDVRWRGRLEDQLGAFSHLEPVDERAMRYFHDPLALSAMTAVLALIAGSVPDRVVKTGLYDSTVNLLALLADRAVWPCVCVRWEVGLLASLGYGLSLDHCALTGSTGDLVHVSPRSGRAVCAEAGRKWRKHLLPLPASVADHSVAVTSPADIAQGFALTGHFLAQSVFGAVNHPLPAARAVMLRRLTRTGIIAAPDGGNG